HARQCQRRPDRQLDDGRRRVAGNSIRRRRFGTDRRVSDAAADARYTAEWSCRRERPIMWGLRISSVLWLGLLVAALLALPLVVTSRFAIDIFIRILLFAFIGVAWNLMGGYAKQLSLGHAAYFGLGAYTSTILQIDFGISPWIGMIAGGVVAMLASLPIGWLCFRLRGPYFTIATIATAQALML